MAPPPITEDYYLVLEVKQADKLELIVKSYRRLSLLLHPDRNSTPGATAAFQLLGQAYETLKDENTRRGYDLVYHSIKRCDPCPGATPSPRTFPTPPPQSRAISEAAQIAVLQKSKQERAARWQTKKTAFDSAVFELQRDIRQLEQKIRNLDSIIAAEAAVEAQKNSWSTWVLSPVYKKVEDTEDEKARKDIERQEKKMERDMKERRLDSKKADVKKKELLLSKAKAFIDAADRSEDEKLLAIRAGQAARDDWERKVKERDERERLAEIRRQKEQHGERQRVERERLEKALRRDEVQRQERQRTEEAAAELSRQRDAEKRAAEQRGQAEESRRRQKMLDDEARRRRRFDTQYKSPSSSTRQVYSSTCLQGGWWDKAQGRKACPECHEVWPYLLECPGCAVKACPKCQKDMRPRMPHGQANTTRKESSKMTTPSPDFDYVDGDDYSK
ncbi:hypothetical protein LTR17_026612 [Elasticomyces elasticus]|nr:hypothetical protein LTR17_026612 [Elasticomyces elasticus]